MSWDTTPLAPFGREVTSRASGASLASIPLDQVREWVAADRVVCFRGFAPLVGEHLPAFGASLGEILEWDFGAVNHLEVREDARNYLFTNHAVPFHWDGAFVGRVPHYILFQCEDAPPTGTGGETLFADAVRMVERATPEQRERWRRVSITYSTEKIVHYGGSFTAALLSRQPVSGAEVVRFAEPVEDLNPVSLEIHGLPPEAHPALLVELRALLYAPEFCYVHPWRPGDIVIADNHATLHGRRAFTEPGRRHLRRVNIL